MHGILGGSIVSENRVSTESIVLELLSTTVVRGVLMSLLSPSPSSMKTQKE